MYLIQSSFHSRKVFKHNIYTIATVIKLNCSGVIYDNRKSSAPYFIQII